MIGSETRPSEFDIPDFRPQRFARATLIGAVGAVIALAAAAAALHPLAKRGAPAARISATPKPQEPVPQPPPELRSPGPVPAPTTTSDGAIQTAPLELAPVEISRDEASSAAVTIKVIPSGAVIFRAGEKLGVGSVQVHVARAAKQRLTALHDGYLPYNFTVDGSRGSVTVRLKLAPRSPIADPAEQAPETTP